MYFKFKVFNFYFGCNKGLLDLLGFWLDLTSSVVTEEGFHLLMRSVAGKGTRALRHILNDVHVHNTNHKWKRMHLVVCKMPVSGKKEEFCEKFIWIHQTQIYLGDQIWGKIPKSLLHLLIWVPPPHLRSGSRQTADDSSQQSITHYFW